MEFYIARELRMTRAELLDKMSALEFIYWCAFLALEAREQEQAQRRAQRQRKAMSMSRRANAGAGVME